MKTIGRFATVLSLSIVLAVLLSGCGREEPQAPAKVPEAPEKTFALTVLVSGVPFWNDTKATWAAVGKGEHVVTSYGGPTDTDGAKQIQEIDALIAKKVDGIVVYPTDSMALVPEINKAVDAGIPVVTYLNDAPGSKRLTYVTSELEDASLKVGNEAVVDAKMPEEAIIMYSEPGNQEQEARKHGFELLVAKHPNLKIVAVVVDKFDETIGAQSLAPLLAKYPNVKYVFGCNSRSAVGAVTALKQAQIPAGKVTVTAWDADADILDLISKGWIKASVYQNSAYMTQLAFNILEAQVGGWMYPGNRRFEENSIRAVPEKIVVPVQLITQANVRGYYPR
jgi:ribose transport system substrate-binding protein